VRIGTPRGRLGVRLRNLFAGLILYGISLAMMIRADLGLDSWNVFHQGVAERSGRSIGSVIIIVSAAVLLLWIPLRERPGFGTISNAIMVGLAVDAALPFLPEVAHLAVRVPLLVGAVALNGVATGLYIGARLGPGPRDGLMTGLARKGLSIRLARTGIEATVLVTGWVLGGSVGVGTVLYAVSIGPLAQYFIPKFTVPDERTLLNG
jgi:uncharacterized membrane protein YczE